MAKAKGPRSGGKQQTSSGQNGPLPTSKGNKENSIESTQNSQTGNKGRNRNREKPKIVNDDLKMSETVDEMNHVTQNTEKKELSLNPKVQPTTEQLMIAKIIDPSDDPHQKKKIQQVMDITGKPEDVVATALFDAAWDESRAVELLLEEGDHLSAWEETGKKKKGKKAEEKEDWDIDNEPSHNDTREKSRGRGGQPPRMRRGGSDARRGGNRMGMGGPSGHDMHENGDQPPREGERGPGGRGGRRGDQPPRRGGRGGPGGQSGGGRTFSSRNQANGGSVPPASSGGGFQGSIDTWNNPNEQNSSSSNDHQRSGADGSGGVAPGPGQSGGQSRRGRGGRGGSNQTGRDAFDNAGNWGDDFPQADDWDNEEYTGSLADTKVFTASSGGPKSASGPSQGQHPQQQAPQQPQPVGSNSQRGFSGGLTSSSNGPSSNSYSQSIDLSTLLQKPTTQSSVGGSGGAGVSAAAVAHFNQQATETLKAVVGIGQNNSAVNSSNPGGSTKENQASGGPASGLYSYAQASSAFTSVNKNNAGNAQGPNKAPQKSQMGRMPSKAPAVEMPGDSLGRLDVQFGGLDLQFGGNSGSANSEVSSVTTGFEFGSSTGSASNAANDSDKKSSSKVSEVSATSGFVAPPSAKEVTKSLSSALTAGGKLNNPNVSSNDSFSNSVKSSSNAPQSTSQVPSQASVNTGASSGGNMANKQQDLYSGYANYGNKSNSSYQYNQYQSYPNSSNFSSQQGQQGQGSGSNNSYKGQFDKYDPQGQLTNPAAAVLGLANTNTTNALSGKVSATTASKVNMPNLPPGVASMLHPQYVAAAGLAPAFYGLQQPMYGAYGNTGLEDLAAIQRASASAAGLHTLPTTGYYDLSLGAAVANRNDGSTNMNSLTGIASTGASSSTNSSTISSGFGSTPSSTSASALSNNAAGDSTSSPGPNSNSVSTSNSGAAGGQSNSHLQQQQTAFNLAATNAFAAQQMPPGYAYYFGNMSNMAGLQHYGATTPGHVYQPTALSAVPGAGATATSQFQKSYGTSYGSGYDALGQQGNKDFSNSYSSNGQSKSSAGGSAASAGSGKGGHQYWGGTTLTSTQLW